MYSYSLCSKPSALPCPEYDPQLLSPFLPLAFGSEHTLLSYSNRTECRAAQVPVESGVSFSRATVTSIGLFTREARCLSVGLQDTEI